MHLIGFPLTRHASHRRASYRHASYRRVFTRHASYRRVFYRRCLLQACLLQACILQTCLLQACLLQALHLTGVHRTGVHLSLARISHITRRATLWLSHCGVARNGCLKRVDLNAWTDRVEVRVAGASTSQRRGRILRFGRRHVVVRCRFGSYANY